MIATLRGMSIDERAEAAYDFDTGFADAAWIASPEEGI